MKIIMAAIILMMSVGAYATPERKVNWENDGYSTVGKFFGGAAYGIVNGADISPRTKKEQISGAIVHMGMASAMVMVNPIGGFAYIGISAIISGIARATHKEDK